jgi:4a-hydroxytetrahydrobiopterin dehydratase
MRVDPALLARGARPGGPPGSEYHNDLLDPCREEPRQRWHLDVWLDPADVEAGVQAALAAGGTVASDEYAPSFWVLAVPDGNRVCLCTWQDRD